MKTLARSITLPAVPLILVLSGCAPDAGCPWGEVPVRVAVGSYSERWVCAPRGVYPETRSPTTSTSPSEDAGAAAAVTSSSSEEKKADESTPAPAAPPAAPAGSCGLVDSQSDAIRVVEKKEAGPAFVAGGPKPADGHYELVQASFFRSEVGPIGVNRLKAGIDVSGTSIGIGAEVVSQTIEANESLTFLLAEDGLTKVCETRHGNVATWLFPIATGATGAARLAYDPQTSTLRLVVARPEGETELVFAR